MKKIILVFLILGFGFLNPSTILSQTLTRSNHLFTFMQNNFDSTIVFFPTNTWNWGANYYIISKKKKQFFLFTYCNPYIIKRYPDSLEKSFSARQSKFITGEPDVNEFFLPRDSKDSVLNIFWNNLSNNRIWNLISTDDNIDDTTPCIDKEGKNRLVISDAGEEYFILITKLENKRIYFYAPEFYEENCPGNVNRINAIKIEQLFREIFK